MNRIYSLVWNRSRKQVEVASELARGHGGAVASGAAAGAPPLLKALAGALLLALAGWAGPVLAATNNCTYTTTGTQTVLCGNGASATGNNAVAIGTNAVSNGTAAIAEGFGSGATGNYSVAIGNGALSNGVGALAEGNGTKAYGRESSAFGAGAQAGISAGTAGQSIALGAHTGATGDQSTALGNNAQASGNSSIAIGGDDLDKVAGTAYNNVTINGTTYNGKTGAQLYTLLTGSTAIAVGVYNTPVAGDGSVALGPQAMAGGTFKGADPTGTFTPNGLFDVAIGAQATATGFSSVALGTGATASGDASFAIGPNSRATAPATLALGISAVANKTNALAIGTGGTSAATYTQATGVGATAIGGNPTAGANASNTDAIAIGGQSSSSGVSGVAIGRGATVGKNDGVAIGDGSSVANANDVALGAGSSTAAPSTGPYTINGGTAAGTGNTNGVVSVGAKGSERQIQNVAAGTVAATSTDAINGSQLYAVGTSLNNLGTTTAAGMGGASSYDPATGKLTTSLSVGGTTYTSVNGALNAVNTLAGEGWNLSANGGTGVNIAPGTKVDVAQGTNIVVTQAASGSLTIATSMTPTFTTLATTGNLTVGGNSTVAGNQNVTGNSSIGGAQTVAGTLTANGGLTVASGQTVNMGGNAIANVGSGGTTATNAANIGDVQKAAAAATSTVAAGTNVAGIGTATASDGHTTYTVNADGASVSAGSSAVTVTQGAKDANNVTDYAVDLSDATKAQLDNAVQYDDSTHAKVTLGGAGATAPVVLTNVAAGDLSAASTDAVNGAQLYATNQNVAANTTDIATNTADIGTLNTTVAQGFNVSANNGATTHNFQLGDTVDVAAGDNVVVAQGGTTGGLTVGLNPILTGLTSLAFAGGGPLISSTGVDMGGTRITNLAPGVDGTDAVNLDQLNAIVAGTATATEVAAGTNVASVAKTTGSSGQSIYTVNADGASVSAGSSVVTVTQGTPDANNVTDYAVDLSDATKAQLDNAVQYDDSTHAKVTLGGAGATTPVTLTNVKDGELSATSTDAINGSQLYATDVALGNTAQSLASGMGGSSVVNPDGSVTTALSVGGSNYTNVNDALNAVNTTANEGWNFTLNGGSARKIGPGDTVGLQQGSNVVLTQSGNDVTIATSDTPAFTSVTTGTGANTVVMDGTGVTVNGGANGAVSLTGTGLDNGGNPISNVAAGNLSATSTDAVNGSQLYATNQSVATNTADIGTLNTTVAQGFNVSANNGATTHNFQLGDTVDVAAGDNVVVAQDGTTGGLTVGLNPILTGLTSIAFAGGGPIINSAGIDMGGTRIANLAPGVAGTDAVNLDQLNAVVAGTATATEVAAGTNVASVAKTTGSSGQSIYTVNADGASVSAGSSAVTVAQGTPDANNVTDYAVDLAQATKDSIQQGVDAETAVTTKGLTFAGDTGTSSVKKLGDQVDITGDANLTTAATPGGVQVTLNKNLDLGTGGSVAIGNTVIDGSGLVITGGPSLTAAGLDNGGGKIANVAAGDLSSTSTDAVNGSQLYATNQNVAANTTDIATNTADIGALNTTVAQGFNVSANNGATTHNFQLGDTVDVAAGDNVVVAQDGTTGGLTVGLNPILTGLTSLAFAGGGPLINSAGIDMGGTRIANLAPGVDGTDAVNLDQLNAVVAGTATATEVAAGTNVASVAKTTGSSGQSIYTVNADGASVSAGSSVVTVTQGTPDANNVTDYAVDLSDATKAQLDNAVQYDDSTHAKVTLGGAGATTPVTLTNVKDGELSATSTDAINGSQLYATNQNVAANTADIATNTADIGTLNTTVAKGFNVSANNGATTHNFQLGDTVDVAAGDNVVVSQDATTGALMVGLNPALTGLTSIAFAGGGPIITNAGIDMGGTRITNLAPGTDGTDAVNLDQLNAVSGVANAGWTLSANGGAGVNIAPGATVDVAQGSNIVVTQSADGSLTIGTSDTPAFTSVTAGTGANTVVMNGTGVTVNGGANGPVSLTGAGLDNGGNKLTNVAAGTAPMDAVNVSQLDGAIAGAKTHFYSVNSSDATAANYDNDGATGADALAAGVGASAAGDSGTAVGAGANAAGYASFAGGQGAAAMGDGAVALGTTTVASGSYAAAVGPFAVAQGNSSAAFGDTANALGNNSLALGANSTATNAGDVALGAGSVTAAANPTASVVINGTTYLFAGANPASVVSVGSAGNERQITNVAAGRLSATSTDAVNGSQLYATNQAVGGLQQQINNINQSGSGQFQTSPDSTGSPAATGSNSAAGGAGATASGNDSLAVGNGSAASGNQGTAVGTSSTASGTGSTAIGDGASATGDNSVALGAGSVAGEDDTVSVGSSGNERRITNVAAGTAPTDAVNVSQLQSAQKGGVQYDTNADGSPDYNSVTLNPGGTGPAVIHNVATGVANSDAVNVGQLNTAIAGAVTTANNYTDQRYNELKGGITQIGNRANAGIASAIAAASLPQPYAPNQSSLGVGLGSFHGEAGIAVGLSKISESGRWILKANVSSDSRGDVGAGVGAGIVW